MSEELPKDYPLNLTLVFSRQSRRTGLLEVFEAVRDFGGRAPNETSRDTYTRSEKLRTQMEEAGWSQGHLVPFRFHFPEGVMPFGHIFATFNNLFLARPAIAALQLAIGDNTDPQKDSCVFLTSLRSPSPHKRHIIALK